MTRKLPSLLALSTSVAGAAVLLTLAAPGALWLRVPLGLPLVVLLPGFGLACALFPHPSAGRLERAALSMGLSLITAVALGLLLDATPIGLTPPAWMLGLGWATIAANAAATVRRTGLAGSRQSQRRARPEIVGLGLVAACFIVLLIVVSAADVTSPASGEIVQLWAQPAPSEDRNSIEVGVLNQISSTTLFRLRVFHGGLVLAEELLEMPVGGKTSLVVHAPPDASELTPVRATLTPVGTGTAYYERSVSIWPQSAPTTGTARPR